MLFDNYNIFHKFALMLLLCFGLKSIAVAQSCDSLIGRWINQDSSILHIDLETNGMIKGHYQSNASNDSMRYPLHGLVNRSEDLPTVSFTVSWGDYGSITSWTGYCQEEENKPTITTMWHLVRPYVEQDWERMLTNKSTFRPHP